MRTNRSAIPLRANAASNRPALSAPRKPVAMTSTPRSARKQATFTPLPPAFDPAFGHPVHPARGEAGDAQRLIDRRIERDGDDARSSALPFTRARTASALSQASARRARACASFMETVRTRALIAAMLGMLTLSSVTPRPIRITAPSGSPAMPPQTPTQLSVRGGGAHGLVDHPQHGRMEPVGLPREHRVAAVHRQHVLRQVVGADRKEVDLLARAPAPSAPPRAPRS